MKIKRIIIEPEDINEPPLVYTPYSEADFHQIIGVFCGMLSEFKIFRPEPVKDVDEEDDG